MKDNLFEDIAAFLRNKPEQETQAPISDEDAEIIINAYLAGLPEGEEPNIEHSVAILKWAYQTTINEGLLGLVLKGLALVSWSEENNSPAFKLSSEGVRYKEKLN